MAEKPTTAFVLSLIGGIFVLIASLLILAAGGIIGGFFPLFGGIVMIFGILGLLSAVLIIIGAAMINSSEPGKVKTGSIIVIVFSILSLFFAGGGFFIGFILALIGGILGLTWKPPPPPVTATATPTTTQTP